MDADNIAHKNLLWRCHLAATIPCWFVVFMSLSIYNAVRWDNDRRQKNPVAAHPPPVAITEGLVPLFLLLCIVVGFHRRWRCVYVLGTLPLVCGAILWWCTVDGDAPLAVVACLLPPLLYLHLTVLLLIKA